MTIGKDADSTAPRTVEEPRDRHARRALLTGGALALTATSLLSASGARAQSQTAGNLYNVRAFGAGGSDDTNAIEAAISAAWNNGGGCIYFPPGWYRCSRKIAFSARPGKSITLLGEGRGVSNILFIAANAGFEFQFPEPDRHLRVAGLSLHTSVPNAGTAIFASWPHNTGAYAHAHIEDVEIRPLDAHVNGVVTDDFWNYGVRLMHGHLSLIRGVWFPGGGTTNSVCAIELLRSNDTVISECHTNSWNFGMNIYESSGTIIRDCHMLDHEVGVRSLSGAQNGLPMIEVSSCHIAGHHRGIQLQNRNEATISNNIIHGRQTGFVAIDCQDNCTEACIHHNRLVMVDNLPGLGIVHSGRHSQINYNIGTMSPCVILRNASTNCVVIGNTSMSGRTVLDEVRSPGNMIRLNNPP